MLKVCILMFNFELIFGCGGGGGGGGYYDEGNREGGTIEEGRFGGFPLPTVLEDKWANFMERYMVDQKENVNRNLTEQEMIDDQRTAAFGWPQTWKGLNAGDSGLKEIPPWAWEPVNDESLPTYCFLNLDRGTSTGIGTEVCTPTKRIGYNPYLKDCVPFTYLGCAGNTNNFVNLELCTEQCMPHPSQGGCDPNLKQFIATLSDLDSEWGE